MSTIFYYLLNKKNKMLIDNLEYYINERSYNYLINNGNSNYPYYSNNDNWNNKNNIRVYNKKTNEHFYLEKVWPNVGDNNLLFVSFPRTDAPIDSWSSHSTQTVNVKTWNRIDIINDFVRFTIESISKDNYCIVSDGYNYKHSGSYARDCFYKIVKILK